eukprot:m.172255 g.172255  ORF g.172255 m.172255 type:complete len:560 (-) comp14829_c0_seq1:1331-3010(-)
MPSSVPGQQRRKGGRAGKSDKSGKARTSGNRRAPAAAASSPSHTTSVSQKDTLRSESTLFQEDTAEAALPAFLRWAETKGFWLHPQLEVGSVDDKGIGVYARHGIPIPSGMVLMRCPESLGLRTRSSGLYPLLRAIRKPLRSQGVPPLSPIDELILTVGYELGLGPRSVWAPYLALLPLRKTRELSVPFLWTGRHTAGEAADAPPVIQARIEQEQAELAEHFASIIAPALAAIQSAATTRAMRAGGEGEGENVDAEAVAMLAVRSPRDYGRIGAVVRGYAFTDFHGTGQALPRLLPLVDMMNHCSVRPTASVLLDTPDAARSSQGGPTGFGAGGETMVARAAVALWPGQEALLSYGRLSSLELLCRYGFVPPANPHDAVEVAAEGVWAQIAGCCSEGLESDAGLTPAVDLLTDMGLLGDGTPCTFRPGGGVPPSLRLMVRVGCLHADGDMADPIEVDPAILKPLAAELEVAVAAAGDDEEAAAAVQAEVQMKLALLQFPQTNAPLERKCLAAVRDWVLQQVAMPGGDQAGKVEALPEAVALARASIAVIDGCFEDTKVL